jgi:hypothetical protein
MFRRNLLVVVLVAVTWGGVARASFIDGNYLHDVCKFTDTGLFQFGDCLGFTSAVADVLTGGHIVSGYRACIGTNVSRGQAKDVVKQWLENHPQHRHLAAHRLVAAALAEGFPCK